MNLWPVRGGINMRALKLSPSILSADFSRLGEEIITADRAGADMIHIDVMDGSFVPNLSYGAPVMKCVRGCTDKPFDVHLMIEHPRRNIDLFLSRLRPGDTVYIHPEAEYHPSTTLQKIKDARMIPGIAINPGTSVETVKEMLRIVDRVLVMAVNPGNASQVFLPYVGEKIEQLIKLRAKMKFDLYWDGACGAERLLEYAPHGVDGFVLGTTLLFGKKTPYKEIIASARNLNFDYLKNEKKTTGESYMS
jgi:ribulose-phosphate 3-epimerase